MQSSMLKLIWEWMMKMQRTFTGYVFFRQGQFFSDVQPTMLIWKSVSVIGGQEIRTLRRELLQAILKMQSMPGLETLC